jgi:NAD-dependent SIR2 family protein deacetylase
MPNQFSSGKYAIAECDRCGQRYKLKELKKLTIKTKQVNIKVCPTCWDPDQPQLSLGLYPVNDPQAVRNPRPDNSYFSSGLDVDGDQSGGSRVFQWGWNPVGGARFFDTVLTPNNLIAVGQVGIVTVTNT